MIKSFFFCLSLFIFPGFCVLGQNRTVTGTVHSAKDSSVLSGVTVLIKGTPKGTSTNASGQFTIQAGSNNSLVFSFIGYEMQELSVPQSGDVIVYMQEGAGTGLSEVVVTTALGIKKQEKTLGYSVQEVSGETMAKTKTSTPLSALTGKVAGLNISNTTDLFQNPRVALRGKAPLIVIDGIPDPDADPYKINADDIESITVLKGTAAGALYGQIGINGAILYTTKRGKRNTLSVEVNSSTMFQTSYTVVPKVQTQYGDGDAGKYAYIDGSGGGVEAGGWIWRPKLDQEDPSTASGFVGRSRPLNRARRNDSM